MTSNKKKRAAIFVDPELRDDIKAIGKQNSRSIKGQIKHWVKRDKSETHISESGKQPPQR